MSSLQIDIDALIENEDVEGLIEALTDEDYLTRKEAAVGLKKIGDERAVEPLIKALKYKSWQEDYIILTAVRENAAEALGIIGDNRALSHLIRALKEDPDEEVRWKAAWALGELRDSSALEPLINALRDESWTVRRHAANSLGMIGDDEALEPLMKALEDKDWHVRKYAAVALGKMRDERAIPILIEALGDEDADVRWKASSALKKIGNMAVVPLINTFKTSKWRIRGRAAEVLGRIGDDRAVEPLRDALLPGRLHDKHRHVRGKAAEALGRIGDPEALEALQYVYNEDEYKYVRDKAEEAIRKLRRASKGGQILNYDNGEVSFDFPSSWDLTPTRDPKKILKGQYANSINFSLNRNSELEDISLDEFSQMLKDVLQIQNSNLLYENNMERDGMEIYELYAENKNVTHTEILIVSFKMEDLLYYLWFAGNPESLLTAEESINLIVDSFHIYAGTE